MTKSPTDLCLRYIYQTNQSVFLTGKAGTGKTTLLKQILKESPKNTIVVAPTGIAALNANGVTIHSMFHLPFGTFIPDFRAMPYGGSIRLENRYSLGRHFRYNKTKAKLLREVELLIIDEVSMLRADVLDAIDWALKTVRQSDEAFGGVQVLFIGDLLQLPPVCKPEEWRYLQEYYDGIYFFNALVLKNNQPIYIELDKIHRQSDGQFIQILNELRNNRLSKESLEILNQRYQPNFDAKGKDNYITLTSHNAIADQMNQEALERLNKKIVTFKALVKGDFPESIYPNDEILSLKEGAQVMFIKNDTSYEKRFYNGKIGVISAINSDEISVYLPEDKKTIRVEQYEWENVKFSIDKDTNEIKEKIVGTYVQYPLRLAWAITIHKSQGLTFDKAVLDVSRVFASGQAYVALSRLRSLEGLILKSQFALDGIENDSRVVGYSQIQQPLEQLNEQFSTARLAYLKMRLITAFDWSFLEIRWRKHLAFYKDLTERSEKGKQLIWAKEQFQEVISIVDVSKKFVGQIHRLFHGEKIDLNFVEERIEKAYEHFYELIDRLNYEVLRKRFELLHVKRVKEYQEELEELDETQLGIMLEMKRVKEFLHRVIHQLPIEKSAFQSEDIQSYRKKMYLKIQSDLEKEKTTLEIFDVNDDWSVSELLKTSSKKGNTKTKEPKVPTHLITYEMHQKGMSIPEIAAERMYIEATIYNHFSKLLEEGKVKIEEVLSTEKLNQLKKSFLPADINLSLSEIRTKLENEFTFEELRLYKTELLRNQSKE